MRLLPKGERRKIKLRTKIQSFALRCVSFTEHLILYLTHPSVHRWSLHLSLSHTHSFAAPIPRARATVCIVFWSSLGDAKQDYDARYANHSQLSLSTSKLSDLRALIFSVCLLHASRTHTHNWVVSSFYSTTKNTMILFTPQRDKHSPVVCCCCIFFCCWFFFHRRVRSTSLCTMMRFSFFSLSSMLLLLFSLHVHVHSLNEDDMK